MGQPMQNPGSITSSVNGDFNFRWHERLHRDREFQRAIKEGRRLVHPALFIFICPRNDKRMLRRLGLVTSRKVGTAVERNRVKRLLRELFRLNKHLLLPGIDMVFILRRGAVGLSLEKLSAILFGLWQTAGALSAKTAGTAEQDHL